MNAPLRTLHTHWLGISRFSRRVGEPAKIIARNVPGPVPGGERRLYYRLRWPDGTEVLEPMEEEPGWTTFRLLTAAQAQQAEEDWQQLQKQSRAALGTSIPAAAPAPRRPGPPRRSAATWLDARTREHLTAAGLTPLNT